MKAVTVRFEGNKPLTQSFHNFKSEFITVAIIGSLLGKKEAEE